jgi:hypothetical protein
MTLVEVVPKDIADANSQLEWLNEEISHRITKAKRSKSQHQPIESFLALQFQPVHRLPTDILLDCFT